MLLSEADVASLIKHASHEMADLNVFAAVIGALENGTIYGHEKAKQRIIRICREEMAVCLRKHDNHVAALRSRGL